MWLPCCATSVSPARLARARSLATSSRLSTARGGGPYLSVSSSVTAATSASESIAAIEVYASSRSRSPGT